ncbi:hypothetical protein M0R45_031102 [Rubus argutus]|uniref:Uncharacterized protein n=1 Tax=Rubus argutus TaxID=59490 RepID=A0AAW1WDP5_RUBAR
MNHHYHRVKPNRGHLHHHKPAPIYNPLVSPSSPNQITTCKEAAGVVSTSRAHALYPHIVHQTRALPTSQPALSTVPLSRRTAVASTDYAAGVPKPEPSCRAAHPHPELSLL